MMTLVTDNSSKEIKPDCADKKHIYGVNETTLVTPSKPFLVEEQFCGIESISH